MRSRREKLKGRKTRGRFLGLPYHLITSPEFCNLSPIAVKALIQIVVEYNGKNNGDLHASFKLFREKGWKSNTTFSKALKELIESGFLIKTRQGFYPKTASLFAVTWLEVDKDFENKYDAGAQKLEGKVLNSWKKSK